MGKYKEYAYNISAFTKLDFKANMLAFTN